MKLYIKTSGGIGNIRIQGEIDTDDLPHRLAAHVRSMFDPAKLALLPHPEDTGTTADGMQYEVHLMSGDDARRLAIAESNAPEDLIDVLQELIQELIRRKSAGK